MNIPPLPPAIPMVTNAVSATPVPCSEHAMLIWDGSPGAAYFLVQSATNLFQPHWTFYGETTIHCFIIDETNGAIAFYRVAAVYIK